MGGRPVVFFDVAQTLALELRAGGGGTHAQLALYDDVPRLLEGLRAEARLGVLTSGDGLTSNGILGALGAAAKLFEPDLILFDGATPAHFTAAVERAGHLDDPSKCILVSPCRGRRTGALRAGMQAAPHPALATALVRGEPLVYARIAGAPREALADLVAGHPIVGMHVDHVTPACYAAAGRGTVDRLSAMGLDVQVLLNGSGVGATDLYLLRMDHLAPDEASAFRERLQAELPSVTPARNGLVIAVPGGRSVDEFHPPDARHGHSIAFGPTVTHLTPRASARAAARPTITRARTALTETEKGALAGLTGALVRKHHEPWCGLAPDPGGRLLSSRNIYHPENVDAAEGIAAALEAICGNVRTPALFADGRQTALVNIHADIVGSSAPSELVIVGAHLDSTAANDKQYPGTERDAPAPGANDDASGVAGVLAVAEALAGLAAKEPPARTIRFMLFNAEEYGFGGSQAAAAELKLAEEKGALRVVAMLQMDMIGWTKATTAPRPFEIHGSGTEFPLVTADSSSLADLVATAAGLVSPGLTPELYPTVACPYDPVTYASDHNSFLNQDWPAVAVCEDEFGDGCSTTLAGDPDYHRASDQKIDADYAADIARAVAGAAWMLAAAPAPVPTALRFERPRSEEKKGRTMPTKYIHEFISDFITNPTLRCEVLKAELTGMRKYGLEGKQITALRSLSKEKIVAQMIEELKDAYGLDLDAVRQVIWPNGDPPPVPVAGPRTFETAAAAAAPAARAAANIASSAESAFFYSEGNIHIRVVEPLNLPLNQEMDVTLRGQGFDVTPEVRFRHEGTQTTVDGTFQSSSCDIDVYQRIRVRVKLTMAGRWTPQARNVVTEQWTDAPPAQSIVVA